MVTSIVDVLVRVGALPLGRKDAMRRRFDPSTVEAIREFSATNWKYICSCFLEGLASEACESGRQDVAIAFYRFLEWTDTFEDFINPVNYDLRFA
jgi:hypothetical protein